MNQAETPELDLILPCYNPQAQWADRVVTACNRIREALPGVSIRLILVNDGSTQQVDPSLLTQLQAQLPAFHSISYPLNRGKGYALRQGVQAATAPLCIYTDIDFPYTEASLIRLYQTLAAGEADVVAGVRDEAYYANVPAGRKRISRMLRWMLRTFLRLRITDTQCGLKGFNTRGRDVFLRTRIDRFLFDLEFIFLAGKTTGIRLLPCEVELKPGIVFSRMNWKVLFRESFNFVSIFFRAVFRGR